MLLKMITMAGFAFAYLSLVSSQDYVIDTLIVVDDVMYNSWRRRLQPNITDPVEISERIKQYVSLVVHQANKRLVTSKSHASFGLQLQVVDIQVDKAVLTFLPASPLTRRINGDQALETFQKWVINQTLGPTYDHVMLLTGKMMESAYEGSAGAVGGRAFVGTVCDKGGSSVSVVQDLGGFQSVYFVAHEAAHSLGAVHDGEVGASACPESDSYLMAAVSQQAASSDHPWYFSRCSVNSISKVLQQATASENNCFAQTSQPLPEFTAAANVQAGQLYDATQQCQMMYGSNSGLCVGDDFSNLDEICTSMYCAKTTSSCVRHYAAEGTSCGHKMWCQMGKCIESEQAPELGECPFGDTSLVLGSGSGSTCAEFISRNPTSCYREDIRASCCSSCANIHTGSAVCPYGDRRGGCSLDVCEQISPDGTLLAELCCGTCSYIATRTCEDVADVDGFTCPERVNAYGKQECYNATVAFHCCESCTEQRREVRGCEYGDIITGTYCGFEARSDNSGCTGSLVTVCCETCSRSPGGDPDAGSVSAPDLLLMFTSATLLLLWTKRRERFA